MIRRLVIIPAITLIILAGIAAALAVADVYYDRGAAILDALISQQEEEFAKIIEEELADAPEEELNSALDGEAEVQKDEYGESAAIGISSWILEQASRALWVAHRLDPWNPEIFRNLGLLYELKIFENTGYERLEAANLNRALNYYRQSIAQRPAWPFVWKHIATLKVKQDQLDKEFALALERATTLGPWEWLVQVEIVDAGLAFWDKLPEAQREIVTATIKRGLKTDFEIFAETAEDMGLIESAEEYLALDSQSPLK